MKMLLSSVILAIFCLSCKKDPPPTLNDKLEGSWLVTEYVVSDIAFTTSYIKYGLALKSESLNKGTIWWAEHRDDTGKKDTITGTYTLDDTERLINIQWKNVSSPFGITKFSSYDLSLSDTLVLKHPDPHYGTLVRAVRN